MGKVVLEKYPKLLHGGDYNPDQWLDRPDILEEDIKLMKKANINTVSMGIFAWSTLEPEEGRYELDWLAQRIDRLYEEGIYTVLATPTGAMPHWLTAKYEEVRQVSPDRVRNLPGKRHNFCYSSPIMREKTKQIDTQLAKRFGKHPGVILWHISNELGGNFSDSSCHCPYCQEAFRKFVKEKYQTLDRLNKAWWTPFWSHTYTSWEQIESPAPHGENILHGLTLDWKRFVSYKIQEFCEEEVKTVKTYSENIPATTNMMTYFYPLDYFKFKDSVDIISWDAYPTWHSQKDEVNVAVSAAVNHNIMRSIKKAPFLLMESTPSITNWAKNNIQKRPGMHKLASLQAVAHGSNSVQYFQFRKSRGSSEKFHGAVVGHDGTGDTRVFRETSEVGAALGSMTEAIYETCNKPQVAIIFDWENWWGITDAMGPKREMNYVETIEKHYKAFWEMGVDVDFIDMDQDISAYRLVVAPMTYMLKASFIDKVKAYVENGGTYVSSYWSNLVDETDLCFLGDHPLTEVLGVITEETDSPNEFYLNEVVYSGKTYQTEDLCDIVNLRGAAVEGVYGKDFYKDTPAVTKNAYGKGNAYFIASRNEYAFQKDFYKNTAEAAGVERNLQAELPYGVTVTRRSGEKAYYFVQNFNRDKVSVTLDADKAYKVVGEDREVSGVLELESYGCAVLEA